ncbi:amidohydrolase family protein [Pantoea sp. EA-12]|uniref:amidohydrolase family protein n=1 Tax=Pantoea sp. EA-12 TaxID=3043303 RepID=UPI0024B60D09|nr:amidohydrolase family protein [Pantoea sp. EA-12]MDI9224196.1 amidohydrolase family protein [Pantoea sp. EA-12]
MTAILIKNCSSIITGDAKQPRSDAAAIRIRGGLIVEMGDLLPQPDETQIDARDCVIYPGWVNTHHHLFQSLLKGEPQGLNLSLGGWLAATPYRFRGAFDEHIFRLAARIGLVELVRSGCTTIADHHYLYWPDMPFDGAAILFDEAEKLGVRFVLCRGGATQSRGLESTTARALQPESFDAIMCDVERLVMQYHQRDPFALRRVAMAPTTTLHSTTPQELRESARLARQLGIRLHSHLSETVDYLDAAKAKFGMSPLQFCAEHDWIGSDVWFAHLVKLLPEEIQLLGAAGSGIAHCPQSNARLGSGIADVVALQHAGVKISIGVDGAASNEAADMQSEAHAAWQLQRVRKGMLAQPRYKGGTFEGGGDAVTVEEIIRWGTAGGAQILDIKTGVIAPGYAADMAIYRLDDPRYFGLHDSAIGPVACGGRASLKALICNGAIIVEEDAIPSVDLAELAHAANQAVRTLQQRAG